MFVFSVVVLFLLKTGDFPFQILVAVLCSVDLPLFGQV